MSIRRQNLEPSQGSIHRITAQQESLRERGRAREMEKTWWHGQRGRDGQECSGLEDINREQQGHIDMREAFITAETPSLPYLHDVLVPE